MQYLNILPGVTSSPDHLYRNIFIYVTVENWGYKVFNLIFNAQLSTN